MNATDLKVFEAVARAGAMNRAAAELNTVQSNVTARIRQLEDGLGVALFVRHARGVALTPAGQRLLPFAQRVGALLEEAVRAARDDGSPSGGLIIGSLETTTALRLSPILARYAAAYPDVDLALHTGTTAELIDRVLARRLEGAFVCGPVEHPDLDEEVIFHEELVILTAPAITSLGDLLGRSDLKTIVLRAGCSYRQRLDEVLTRRGIAFPRQLEFGTLEAIFGCVSGGLGLTLLPKSLIGAVWREGRVGVHELPAQEARVETVFICRKDAYRSSALTAFVDEARAAFQAERRAA